METLAYVGTQLGRSVERERSERRLGDLAAREQQRIGRLEIESEPGRGTCVRVAAAEGSGRGLH